MMVAYIEVSSQQIDFISSATDAYFIAPIRAKGLANISQNITR